MNSCEGNDEIASEESQDTGCFVLFLFLFVSIWDLRRSHPQDLTIPMVNHFC